jgi:hypothetical protein
MEMDGPLGRKDGGIGEANTRAAAKVSVIWAIDKALAPEVRADTNGLTR